MQRVLRLQIYKVVSMLSIVQNIIVISCFTTNWLVHRSIFRSYLVYTILHIPAYGALYQYQSVSVIILPYREILLWRPMDWGTDHVNVIFYRYKSVSGPLLHDIISQCFLSHSTLNFQWKTIWKDYRDRTYSVSINSSDRTQSHYWSINSNQESWGCIMTPRPCSKGLISGSSPVRVVCTFELVSSCFSSFLPHSEEVEFGWNKCLC